MLSYRVIALTAVLAVLSPFGITSAQAPQAVEQRQQAEERKQAEERRQDMEKRQDAEHRQDAQRRPGMEQREQAERRQDADHRQDAVARSKAPGLARAEEMVGLRVVNRQDNRGLGKVTGLVRNPSGQVDAVVIEHGGFMGFFTNSVTVPGNQLELSADGKTVVTNMDRSQLRAAAPVKRN
jgi:ribosomal 30S subunit maturation factor RimM